METLTIGIIYDKIARPDTIGNYYERALKEIGHEVIHYGIADKKANNLPLYLQIDDDFYYQTHTPKNKSAYVIIDGHRLWNPGGQHNQIGTGSMPFWRVVKAWDFKNVFVSQKHIAAALKDFDMNAHHLPVAADPATWHKIPGTEKKYDWCHVGSIYPEKETVINALKEKYPNCYVGSAPPAEANKIINESKVSVNISFNRDIPMRVFETMMAGTFLLTPFDPVIQETVDNNFPYTYHTYPFHPAPFNKESLLLMMDKFLGEDQKREKIAEADRQHALQNHTFKNRVETILEKVMG